MKAYRAFHFSVSPVDKTEYVSAWLTTFPFESFVHTDTGVTTYIPLEEASFISAKECLEIPFDGVEVVLKIEDIEGQNWNRVWEEQFHPITIGDWTVRASFHFPAQTTHELIIDPQMSFGTGHHATTQLMLAQLMELTLFGSSVLDMGTGTGVLAIAAKKMGASRVVGVDIEDWCVENSKENALKNGIDDILFHTDDMDTFSDSKFNLIIANINRNVLMSHIPTYAKMLHPNGILLLSGFHREDVELLSHSVKQHGLTQIGETEKEGWICLKCII